MSNANFCWFCSKALIGPGGKPHREPLRFHLIKTHDGYEVRVHAGCEEAALRYVKLSSITAAPPPDPWRKE